MAAQPYRRMVVGAFMQQRVGGRRRAVRGVLSQRTPEHHAGQLHLR
eukprot:COSAG01_NODE_63172_length_281_cov_0.571429_1_plen_45_part_01